VLGVRFLSLVVIVAALFVARVALSAPVASSDRTEMPSGGDQGDAGDACDLALPSHATFTAVLPPPRPLVLVAERAPATCAFDSRIFRPPISALA
jgi:hypothetical protein